MQKETEKEILEEVMEKVIYSIKPERNLRNDDVQNAILETIRKVEEKTKRDILNGLRRTNEI